MQFMRMKTKLIQFFAFSAICQLFMSSSVFSEQPTDQLNITLQTSKEYLKNNKPQKALDELMNIFPVSTASNDQEYEYYQLLDQVQSALASKQTSFNDINDLPSHNQTQTIKLPPFQGNNKPRTQSNTSSLPQRYDNRSYEISPMKVKPPKKRNQTKSFELKDIHLPKIIKHTKKQPQKTKTAQQLLTEARITYNSGKTTEAELLINEYLLHDSQNAMAYELAAQIYNKNKDYERSALALEKTLQLDPNFPDANLHLGNLYGRIKNYQKSIIHLKKASEKDPDNAKIYYNLAVAYKEIGDPAQAQSYLQQCHQVALEQKNYKILQELQKIIRK